jgi:hypothetical protein
MQSKKYFRDHYGPEHGGMQAPVAKMVVQLTLPLLRQCIRFILPFLESCVAAFCTRGFYLFGPRQRCEALRFLT